MQNNNFKYQLAELKEVDRYWFKRVYTDESRGRERSIVIMVEKKMFNQWSVLVEERKAGQTWQLERMSLDGEQKIFLERTVQGKSGIKTDLLSLGYAPNWLVQELVALWEEIKMRQMDENLENFVQKLIGEIMDDKTKLRSTLTATIEDTNIGGLYKIMSQTRGDERGSFREVARFPEIELLTGYDFLGKQVNHSYSIYGTLRGLHVEPWAKLVTVISGLVVCKMLDCRPKSKTFGQVETVYLGFGQTPDGQEVRGGAMFVEAGIANSFMVLSERVDYSYVVDDLWTPGTATYSVNPMDPKLQINWKGYVPEEKIIRSERDIKAPSFEEFSQQIKNF